MSSDYDIEIARKFEKQIRDWAISPLPKSYDEFQERQRLLRELLQGESFNGVKTWLDKKTPKRAKKLQPLILSILRSQIEVGLKYGEFNLSSKGIKYVKSEVCKALFYKKIDELSPDEKRTIDDTVKNGQKWLFEHLGGANGIESALTKIELRQEIDTLHADIRQIREPTLKLADLLSESIAEETEQEVELPSYYIPCTKIAGIIRKRSDAIARTLTTAKYPVIKKANRNYCDPEHAAVLFPKWKKYLKRQQENE